MNLPQNINKSDGAIARSFSQELGLNLDFKTGRELIWHSQESIGENGYFLMKNGERLVAIDTNIVSVFDFKMGSLLKTHSFKDRIHNCFKLNEQVLLVHGGWQLFRNLNIDTGVYDNLEMFHDNYRMNDLAFNPELKLLAIECPRKTIDFYNIETKAIEKQLDVSSYNQIINDVYFINDGRYLVIGIKKELLIFDAHNLILLHNINLDELPIITAAWKVLQIKDEKALLQKKSGCSLHWINLQTGTVIKSDDFTMYENRCNLFVWGSKYLVKNESTDKDNKVTNLKLIDSEAFKTEQNIDLVNIHLEPISICNDYLIGLREKREIIVYNQKFEMLKTMSLPRGTDSLDRYHKKSSSFIFEHLLFNVNTEQVYTVKHDEGRLFNLYDDADFNQSNYHVYLLKVKSRTKRVKLLFVNLETNESHVFNPLVPDKPVTKIIVKYLSHLNLWLLMYGGYMTIYDADTQNIVKHFGPDDLPSMPGNHWDWKISPRCILGECIYDYSEAKGFLQMFNLNTKQTSHKTFAYNYDVSDLHHGENYTCGLLAAPKRNVLFLIEAFSNTDTKESRMQLSEFDKELNLLRTHDIVIDEFKPIKDSFSNLIAVDENSDRIIIAGSNKFDRKKLVVYAIEINNLGIELISEMKYNVSIYRHLAIDLSKNKSYLSLYYGWNRDEVYLLNLNTGQWLGEIEDFSSRGFLDPGFDESNNLIIAPKRYHTDFYHLEPFAHIGSLYVEPGGTFYIGLFPDKTSPNGWFYTNSPNKINVLKTKADGSEPELLPIDDEDRQAFIKHHNRKDIVMKKLFDPEAYEQFARLNAGAEDLAKQDMAIELSKVEAKRLNNNNSK